MMRLRSLIMNIKCARSGMSIDFSVDYSRVLPDLSGRDHGTHQDGV